MPGGGGGERGGFIPVVGGVTGAVVPGGRGRGRGVSAGLRWTPDEA